MEKRGMMLYLWLSLFTMFVSFFSIILFNYVGADIKAVRSLYLTSRKHFDYRSIAMVLAEMYKETGRTNGNYITNLAGVRYNIDYRIRRLTDTDIMVELIKNNEVVGRSIVRIKNKFDNLALITTDDNVNLQGSDYYSSGWIMGNRVNVQGGSNGKKVLSWGVIRPDTIVNGKGGFNEENLKELRKYADFASYGDYRQVLFSYYNQLYDQISNMAKNYNGMENYYNVNRISPNHPHNFIQLTPSGILYIKRTNLYQKIVLRFNNFVNNQWIDIYGLDYSNNLIFIGEFDYYDNVARTVSYGTILISNDPDIMNPNGYSPTNANYLFYPDYYLYSSCLGYQYGDPTVDTIIRFPRQIKPVMIIYSEMPIDIVGFSNTTPQSKISQQIMIITKEIVTIQDDLFYLRFNEYEFIYTFRSISMYNYRQPDPLFTVLAQEIVFDSVWPDVYSAYPTMCDSYTGPDFVVVGDYIAMFDSNSRISWVSGYASNFYIFGSLQGANLDILNANIGKYFVSDNRLTTKDPNIKLVPNLTTDSLYLNTLTPVFTEVIK